MIQGKLQDYEKIVETCFIYSLTSHNNKLEKNDCQNKYHYKMV